MPQDFLASAPAPRVRFAPSPTGFLHVGHARTFIFNWLYARHNGGTMVFRLDDTDVERNTEASVQSIFEGLSWLGLDWDENYKQSERLDLYRTAAWAIFEKGFAYRDFTPVSMAVEDPAGGWLFNQDMRELSREESDRRANAGEPFVLRFRVPRESRAEVVVQDLVYGSVTKAASDLEDFALTFEIHIRARRNTPQSRRRGRAILAAENRPDGRVFTAEFPQRVTGRLIRIGGGADRYAAAAVDSFQLPPENPRHIRLRVDLVFELEAVAQFHEFVCVARVAILAAEFAAAVRIQTPLERHAGPGPVQQTL